jgi:hypothetical protein
VRQRIEVKKSKRLLKYHKRFDLPLFLDTKVILVF